MVKMIVDSFYIPKDNPLKPYGEDAHFFHKGAQVIGVADGFSETGIDAGEYARQLMRNAEYAVDNWRRSKVDPKHILIEAFYRTNALGSTTVCIMALVGNKLRAANLGDCGFLLLRGGKVFYRSPVQQHQFNCPYRLGDSSLYGPESAERSSVEVQGRDALIVGSHGLFDNLFPEEIAKMVNDCLNWNNLPEDLARAALRKSSPMNNAPCPYRVAAMTALGKFSRKHKLKLEKFLPMTYSATPSQGEKSEGSGMKAEGRYDKRARADIDHERTAAYKEALEKKAREKKAREEQRVAEHKAKRISEMKMRAGGGESYDKGDWKSKYAKIRNPIGGTYDDITVVVAHIVPDSY